MNKQIFITNGTGGTGKDKFATFIGQYISTYKYTIRNLPTQAAIVLGYDGVSKTEKDRRFLSDIKDLADNYNDSPYRDVVSLVADFLNNKIETEVLIVDMRDSKDISRAIRDFGAKTILVRNPRTKKIRSNHADANVERYHYDYIIENNGTLEQLEGIAKEFVDYVIKGNSSFPIGAHCIFDNKKKAIVFQCDKVLRAYEKF